MSHRRFPFPEVVRSRRRILLIAVAGVSLVCIVLFLASLLRPAPRTRGFVLKTYVDRQGQEHKYLVFVPYDYQPGEERPLLLFLNGMGENGTDGLSAIHNNFGIEVWEMKRCFPFVAAIPQCQPGGGWTEAELHKALAIMDRVAEDYGTDPDRVYVTGVSSGGGGVWSIISSYPGRFAAAVPLCGGPSGDAKALAKSQLQIWNFYNDADDEPGLVEANRAVRQRLIEAGASPIVTEYSKRGHNSWDLAYRCAGMYDWLLDQSLSKNARQTQPFELLSADQILSAWRSHGPANWTAEDDHTFACENVVPDQPGYLISDAAYGVCEFHVDVYLDSQSEECQLGLFDVVNGDSVSGYTLHLPLADTGSGGLTHSTGGWIATLDPVAGRQLRTDYWNDVRLHFGKGRITARINGWKAIDVQRPGDEGREFHVALGAPHAQPGTHWRNVRLRQPDGPVVIRMFSRQSSAYVSLSGLKRAAWNGSVSLKVVHRAGCLSHVQVLMERGNNPLIHGRSLPSERDRGRLGNLSS